MTLRDPAWLRSARARPAAFAALVLLSLAAVLISAVTPMLLAALDATTLREGVAEARLPDDGVVAITQLNQNNDLSIATAGLDSMLLAAGEGSDRWGRPQQVIESKVLLQVVREAGTSGGLPISVSVSTDQCAGLVLDSGRCPYRAWDVLAARSLAADRGWRTGTTLQVAVPGAEKPVDVHVVGVYDDRAGLGRIAANPLAVQGAGSARAVPNLVMDDSAFSVLTGDFQLTGSREVVRPIRQSDVAALRRGVLAAELAASGDDAGLSQGKASSGLPDLLDGITRAQAASATLMAPIGVAGLILAWYALFVVAQRSARARAVEWGIDRTRGMRVRSWLASVFTEPVVAIVLGAVLGYPAAVLVAAATTTVLLGGTADLAPFAAQALIAAVLALAGSLAALVAASVRAALLPLNELLQDTVEPRRATRLDLVGRVVLLTLTAATIWAVLTAPAASGPQLGLLLPVLLALVVGLVARLVAVLLVRRTASRVPRTLTTLMVGRGLARAPSGLAAVQLLLVAVAVATYVLQLQAVSAAVQTDRAELALGAPQVLTVAVPRNASLLAAVRRADPAGRTAMAAVEVGGDDAKGAARMIAVDTQRLDAVGAWREAWRGGVEPARLATAPVQDLVLRGSTVTATVTDVDQVEYGVEPRSTVRLKAVLATGSSGWREVVLGDVEQGTLRTSIPCTAGCRVVALGVDDVGPDSGYGWDQRFTITRLSTDRQTAAQLQPWLTAGRWRDRIIDSVNPDQPARAEPGRAATGLAVEVADQAGGQTPQLEPALGPVALPVIAARATPLIAIPASRGDVLGSSLANETIRVRPVAKAPALPWTLRDGVLADLGAAQRFSDPSTTTGVQQVWMTAGAHPSVLRSLQQQGVRVLGRQEASAAVRIALTAATNRAVGLSGTAAVAGLLFALLALVATRIVDAPARRRDWLVLRRTGATSRRLRRLASVQIAAPSAIAIALGVGSGLLAGALTLGGLPLLVDRTAGPPVDVTPPVGPLLVLAVVMLLLCGVIAAVSAAIDLTAERR